MRLNGWMIGLIIMMLTVVSFTHAQQVTLYVDGNSPLASDSNDGTANAPLLTIGHAATLAVDNKRNNISTKVEILPGVYREFVDLQTYTNFSTNQPDNTTPMIFEARFPGLSIVTGADRFTNWTDEGAGLFSHDWPYNWGVAEDPTGGAVPIADIVLRREVVFVDQQRLNQVMSALELTASTYYVDENNDRLYVQAPTGVALNDSNVVAEVGVREKLWQQEFENFVTIRGLIFEHAATRWQNAVAAVRVSSSDHVLIDNVRAHWNNAQGLYIGESDNVTLTASHLNNNGWQGWSLFRLNNFLAQQNQTSFNNWRGHLGAFYGWSVGNKLFSVHDATILEHQANGNFSRGLWLDTDIKNVVLDQVNMLNNVNDAIFLEVSPGPITIRDSVFCGNGGRAVLGANTENVLIVDSTFCQNTRNTVMLDSPRRSELLISGVSDGRISVDFETGEEELLFIKNWTVVNNTIAGDNPGSLLFETTLDLNAWNEFIDTLSADYNDWSHTTLLNVYDVYADEVVGFSNWQCISGQDLHSTFNGQTSVCPTDFDLDGVPNAQDNCTTRTNSLQIDTDADGYGNACDGDFDNNCITNFADLAIFATNFLAQGDNVTDINGDSLTNFADLSLFSDFFLQTPGPSAQSMQCN